MKKSLTRVTTGVLLTAGMTSLFGCSNVITSIKEENGSYYMTVQQHGGVRGTVSGRVWHGTYDAQNRVMRVREHK